MEQRGHLAVSLVVTVWRPSMGTTAGLWEPEAGVHLCCCQAEVGKGGSGSSRIMEVMSPMCVCHTCIVFPATLLPPPTSSESRQHWDLQLCARLYSYCWSIFIFTKIRCLKSSWLHFYYLCACSVGKVLSQEWEMSLGVCFCTVLYF